MEKKYVIIVDEDRKPMAWSEDQLCYCTDERWQDEPHPVRVYEEKAAKVIIKKSEEYTKNNNLSSMNYYLMPVSGINL